MAPTKHDRRKPIVQMIGERETQLIMHISAYMSLHVFFCALTKVFVAAKHVVISAHTAFTYYDATVDECIFYIRKLFGLSFMCGFFQMCLSLNAQIIELIE